MRRVTLVLATGLLLTGCQILHEQMPQAASSPSPTGPAQTPVVVPVAIPSPVAPPATQPPATQPVATQPPGTQPPATQPPAGPPPATAQGCGLPPGDGPGNYCPRESPSFLSQVEAALDRTTREHPEAFNMNDGGPCGNCYFVRDVAAYERYVVQNLQAQGLCAIAGEEFGVKNTNNFNDQYDLMTADMHIRRQLGSYRGTCRPADF
jgi:hypothetical protein